MARPLRIDAPGLWHHVVNCGVGERTIHEGRRDTRFLLSRVARMVREGLIEVHAYAILANHFHFLVRSLKGELSQTIKWIEEGYARYFNRTRSRSGPLYRHRFWSEIVDNGAYWLNVLRYIDRNPVEAGLVVAAEDYSWGSAHLYATARRPRWLRTDVVERFVKGLRDVRDFEPRLYRGLWPTASLDQDLALGRSIPGRGAGEVGIDRLVTGSCETVRAWMLQRATNADAVVVGMILTTPPSLLRAVADLDARLLAPKLKRILTIGLARAACGLTCVEAANLTGRSPSTVSRMARRHQSLMLESELYATCAAGVLKAALELDHMPDALPFTPFGADGTNEPGTDE